MVNYYSDLFLFCVWKSLVIISPHLTWLLSRQRSSKKSLPPPRLLPTISLFCCCFIIFSGRPKLMSDVLLISNGHYLYIHVYKFIVEIDRTMEEVRNQDQFEHWNIVQAHSRKFLPYGKRSNQVFIVDTLAILCFNLWHFKGIRMLYANVHVYL
jgi:hypothetical protein